MAWNVMVDLETMSTRSDAAIVAIGAVAWRTGFFRPDTKVPDNRFYQLVKLESSLRNGMRMDSDTVLWWLAQSEDARAELTKGQRAGLSLNQALLNFREWFLRYGGGDDPKDHETTIWGNGATFDNVILSNAFLLTLIDKPWGRKQDRCYRTAVALLDPTGKLVPPSNGLPHHNALGDALWQAEYLDKLLTEVP